MEDSTIIIVVAIVSFLYFILGIARKKNNTQNEPESLTSPDPQAEKRPEPQAEDDESKPQITFEELLEEFLPDPEKKNETQEDDHFAPYALTETEKEDRQVAIREEHSLKPKFKQKEVNLEKLAIKKIINDKINTTDSTDHPISELMQNPDNLRNAFILKEILNRPYENDDTF